MRRNEHDSLFFFVVNDIFLDGHIRLYTDADVQYPLIKAHDPHPLKVKYLSFASYSNAEVSFYYNCGNWNLRKNHHRCKIERKIGKIKILIDSKSIIFQIGNTNNISVHLLMKEDARKGDIRWSITNEKKKFDGSWIFRFIGTSNQCKRIMMTYYIWTELELSKMNRKDLSDK